MTTINLKDFYPWYIHDEYIEVSEEVADELRASRLYEAAYQRRIVRNRAQYSLDCEDGIEYSACVSEPTPQELLERMELFCHLCAALNSLPETQGPPGGCLCDPRQELSGGGYGRRREQNFCAGVGSKRLGCYEKIFEKKFCEQPCQKPFFCPWYMRGVTSAQQLNSGGPRAIERGARRRVRCDFSGRRTSEQHQRRKWDKPTHGHDPKPDKLAACPSGPPPPRGASC